MVQRSTWPENRVAGNPEEILVRKIEESHPFVVP
jgi:hypothetical protein